MAIASLLEVIPAGGRAYAVAADLDQGRLLADAVASFVSRTPGLRKALSVDRYSVTAANGSRLEILASDAPSAFGLRAHLFICDEVSIWPASRREVWTAIISAVPKTPGCQAVVLSTAGDPAGWAYRIRERARVSPQWRLHEQPGPLDWIDPSALEEQRALLTTAEYERLHENKWVAAEDRLVSFERLRSAVTLDGPQPARKGVTYAIGVDVGLRHDATAIAVAHGERVGQSGRRVVIDNLVTLHGTKEHEVQLADIEEAIHELHRHYGKAKVRIDPWQAVGLVQRLRRRRVRVDEWAYSAKRYAAAASALFGLLRDGNLALFDHPEMLDELANVRLQETAIPGQLRMQHDPDKHDDIAQAIGFAVLAVLENPAGVGRLEVFEGRLPRVALSPSREDTPDGAVPVVTERGERPAIPPQHRVRVGPFTVDRRFYTPPGARSRP